MIVRFLAMHCQLEPRPLRVSRYSRSPVADSIFTTLCVRTAAGCRFVSELLPVCVRAAGGLCPDCCRSVSELLPVCVRAVAGLCPGGRLARAGTSRIRSMSGPGQRLRAGGQIKGAGRRRHLAGRRCHHVLSTCVGGANSPSPPLAHFPHCCRGTSL